MSCQFSAMKKKNTLKRQEKASLGRAKVAVCTMSALYLNSDRRNKKIWEHYRVPIEAIYHV